MIDIDTQLDLFKLISRSISKDIAAYAFGGTAMLFYGYKTATKDIDLLFETKDEFNDFIKAIENLGYSKLHMKVAYSKEKQQQKGKPIMYSRGEERFDLFLKKIFGTTLIEGMKKRLYARHDFTEKENLLSINVLAKEDLILLKSVTGRENDFNDILTIVEKEKNINWGIIVDNAITQKNLGDPWIVLELEKTMQRLRSHILIKKLYFDKLYKSW